MKNLSTYFGHLLSTVVVIFGVLVGFLAAALSAAIEYDVLAGIMDYAKSDLSSLPNAFPLATVIALEGSKIFLHVLIEMGGRRDQSLRLPVGLAKTVRNILVALSLACTLLWSVSNLYSPVVSADEAQLQQDIAAIEQQYAQEITALENSADEKIAARVQAKKDRAEADYKQYENYTVRGTGYTWSEKERLYEAALASQAEYDNALVQAQKDVPAEIAKEVRALEQERDLKISERTELTTTNQDANSFIHVVLTATSHYLLGQTTYSPKAYFAVAVVFAIVLAGVLEAIISLSLRFVALKGSEWREILDLESLPSEGLIPWRTAVNVFLAATVSTLCFLVWSMFAKLSIDQNSIIAALVVFVGSNVLLNSYKLPALKTNEEGLTVPKGKAHRFWDELMVMAVKGCFTFVAFILIGFVFGSEFQELTLPAVGMTIGSAGGQLIKLPNTQAV